MTTETDPYRTQFKLYEKFHKNPTNQLIHLFAIPQIIWTTCIFLSYIPVPIITNMSYLVYGLLSIYYFNIDRKLGKDMTAFIGSLLLFSKFVMIIFSNHFFISSVVFTLSWIAQFAGHYIWEKKSPAFLTSLFDAFTMAPIFCFIELQEKYHIVNKVERFISVSSIYIKNGFKELFGQKGIVRTRVNLIEKNMKQDTKVENIHEKVYSSDDESISDGETDGESDKEKEKEKDNIDNDDKSDNENNSDKEDKKNI